MELPPTPDSAAPVAPPPPAYQAPYAPPPAYPAQGGYPVQLTVTGPLQLNRLWGVPYFGVLVRLILAIPQFIVLMVLALGMYVVMLLGWIPILLLGRPVGIQAAWIKEMIHRGVRILGYAYFLMPGGYPGFAPGDPNPVALTINLEGRSMSRLWGIPFFGIMVRYLVLIPHFIVLYILMIVGFILEIVLWIPILFMGRYPGWAVSLYGGLLRYAARVEAYLFLLPIPYPPFSLS